VRKFSQAQEHYLAAKVIYDATHEQFMDQQKAIDVECEKLGIETPYGILPVEHPLMIQGQALLDAENVAKDAMYAAAFILFDWAIETTLSHVGTEAQKATTRAFACTVKKMAFVEQPFIDLVNLSLQLPG
jgi:hypothetical protein